MAERPAAVLLVLAPSGQRSRVALDSMPFSIGRQSGNSLVLRDNRTSRNHCRIVFENGSYAIEDLNSRHGTFVNGRQISRHVLHNSDRIEFGVRDSYQLTFSAEQQDIQRLLGQFGSVRDPCGRGVRRRQSDQAAFAGGSGPRAAKFAFHQRGAYGGGGRCTGRYRLRTRLSAAASGGRQGRRP